MTIEILLKVKGWVSFEFEETIPIRRDTEVPQIECENCWLAYFSHPMIIDRRDIHGSTFIKYCTKDFLKYNFINSKELI